MEDIIARLKTTDADALYVIKRVLEARAESATARLNSLELRSEVCKGYALIAELISRVAEEKLAEADTMVKASRPLDWTGYEGGVGLE